MLPSAVAVGVPRAAPSAASVVTSRVSARGLATVSVVTVVVAAAVAAAVVVVVVTEDRGAEEVARHVGEKAGHGVPALAARPFLAVLASLLAVACVGFCATTRRDRAAGGGGGRSRGEGDGAPKARAQRKLAHQLGARRAEVVAHSALLR
jgi:hypothetical protein